LNQENDQIKEITKKLEMKLENRQARLYGICDIREEIYEEVFDEVIRQVTLNNPERGKQISPNFQKVDF
jgi:dynein light intermediate chain